MSLQLLYFASICPGEANRDGEDDAINRLRFLQFLSTNREDIKCNIYARILARKLEIFNRHTWKSEYANSHLDGAQINER